MFGTKILIPILFVFALASMIAATSFSSASIRANGKLNIVDTNNGLIGLFPGSVSTIQNHKLVLDFSSGLQTNSSYTFKNAFSIKNNSPETMTVGYSGLPLGQYGEVETKAYNPELDQYYNKALEDGFPLESGQTAEIALYIHIGNHTANLENMNFNITAEKGSLSNNTPHNGAIPQNPSTDSGENTGEGDLVDCKNTGQCQTVALDLLNQLKDLENLLNKTDAQQYYNMAQDWYVNLDQSVSNLNNIVDKLPGNGDNNIDRTIDECNSLLLHITKRLQELHT